MSDYEKSSVVTYSFYFINRQSIHKTNRMQIIKKILCGKYFAQLLLSTHGPKLAYCAIFLNKLVKHVKKTLGYPDPFHSDGVSQLLTIFILIEFLSS